MGVIQLINKKTGAFSPQDEKYISSVAETLALAFHNQGKMVEQKPTKFSHLLSEGLITDDELTNAIANARKNQLDIETILLKDLGLKRKDVGKSLENFYKIPYQAYSDTIILPQQVMTGLNKNFLLKNFWLPLLAEDNKVAILINDPTNPEKIQSIKLLFPKKQLEFKVGLKVDVVEYLNSSLGVDEQFDSEAKSEEITSLLEALKSEKEGGVAEDAPKENDEVNAISETDSTIVRLVNKILTDAFDQGISDIHIEPGIGKDSIMVRFRKDGTCQVYEEIPYVYKQAIISRIKIMSKLDIAERRLPQDGKIKMKYGKKDVEFRVATCPTVGGNEDAVLRILAASKPIPLDNMNFSPRNLSLTKTMSDKPYGLILVVGPTGSGKTTTLHSCLGFINNHEVKIWTAEDPVEITQKGLRQVQMQSKIGLDFARAMRSFLRGDPDIIMVGEMRDAETCAIGLEASLTGHMVFSTLHTNSAPETITRLLDMGMNPLNFADALLLILAQRLVRTLCKKCKTDYHITREEFQMLVNEYGEEQFQKLSIQYSDSLMIKKFVGCPDCNNTGYAGRTGLHELLEGTAKMKRMIMQKKFVEELREQAIVDGMTTLKQDGIYKILKGDTDLKQVLSVCIA
jgi:type II secretory ATPase GspE/PulE/Tfp pilus assembly ATPase PilB-like protein